MVEAIDAEDSAEVCAAADDLIRWLDRDGFVPAVELADGLRRQLSRRELRAVLDLIRCAAGPAERRS